MKVYLVGGAVRDELLGRPVADLDFVVTGSTPAELLAAGYTQIGQDFPTFLHPETKHEYALARTERKSGSGHTGFICDFGPELTLEEDLERRDLTINAMARDDNGELVDPYGGLDDLRAQVFRHVSDAFREDPLRILRVARFAARLPEFSLAPETLELMTTMTASGEVEDLSVERVWKETVRALAETSPSRYFGILKACGALERLFPELSELSFDYELQTLSEEHFQIGLQLDMAASLNETADVVFGVCTARLDPDAAAGLAARLKAPTLTQLLVRRVAQEFERVDSLVGALLAWIDGRSGSVVADLGADCLKLIEACDGFRRPAVFRDCVKACLYALWKSDSSLSTKAGGGECVNLCTIVRIQQSYFSAVEQTFLACQQTAAAVEAKSLVQQGYRGEAVGMMLRELRLAAIIRHLAGSSLDYKQEN